MDSRADATVEAAEHMLEHADCAPPNSSLLMLEAKQKAPRKSNPSNCHTEHSIKLRDVIADWWGIVVGSYNPSNYMCRECSE